MSFMGVVGRCSLDRFGLTWWALDGRWQRWHIVIHFRRPFLTITITTSLA